MVLRPGQDASNEFYSNFVIPLYQTNCHPVDKHLLIERWTFLIFTCEHDCFLQRWDIFSVCLNLWTKMLMLFYVGSLWDYCGLGSKRETERVKIIYKHAIHELYKHQLVNVMLYLEKWMQIKKQGFIPSNSTTMFESPHLPHCGLEFQSLPSKIRNIIQSLNKIEHIPLCKQ